MLVAKFSAELVLIANIDTEDYLEFPHLFIRLF